jgi:hypothetical protein
MKLFLIGVLKIPKKFGISSEKDWKIIRKRLDFDEKMRFVC